ncbi:MAG TPA: membrane dipeptidase [Falsiroseomonas sp.]|jgi:membrane dipeptidase|nr:membrane dipeptidase [Falsiroseomonas sp.]
MSGELTAGAEAIAFTRDTFVFDCLTLNYALEDEYAARCAEGGVNAFNITVAAEEESWDDTLRLTDSFLTRIAKSPYLQQATDSAGIAAANRAGKIAVILGGAAEHGAAGDGGGAQGEDGAGQHRSGR